MLSVLKGIQQKLNIKNLGFAAGLKQEVVGPLAVDDPTLQQIEGEEEKNQDRRHDGRFLVTNCKDYNERNQIKKIAQPEEKIF